MLQACFPSSSDAPIPTSALIMSALAKAKQFSLPRNAGSLDLPGHFDMQEPQGKVASPFLLLVLKWLSSGSAGELPPTLSFLSFFLYYFLGT